MSCTAGQKPPPSAASRNLFKSPQPGSMEWLAEQKRKAEQSGGTV